VLQQTLYYCTYSQHSLLLQTGRLAGLCLPCWEGTTTTDLQMKLNESMRIYTAIYLP